jgi:hypothetical protein
MTLECIYEDKPWPSELVDVYQFGDTWTHLRLIGQTSSYYEFWLPVNRGERIISVHKICACYKPGRGERQGTCAYCRADLKGRQVLLSNAIIRELQGNGSNPLPRPTEYEKVVRQVGNESVRWKEKGSASWTPIRVVRLAPRLASQIRSLDQINKARDPETGEVTRHSVAHPRYGRDVLVLYDGEYFFETRLDMATELTKEELSYLRYPLDLPIPETPERTEREWKRLKPILRIDS